MASPDDLRAAIAATLHEHASVSWTGSTPECRCGWRSDGTVEGETFDQHRADAVLAAIAAHQAEPEPLGAQDECPTCKGRGSIDTPVTPEGYLLRDDDGMVIDTFCRHGLRYSLCSSCKGDSFAAERDKWDRDRAAGAAHQGTQGATDG